MEIPDEEFAKLLKRIEDLEGGKCRFNCRTERAAFMAGFLWEDEETNGFEAYKEWKESS